MTIIMYTNHIARTRFGFIFHTTVSDLELKRLHSALKMAVEGTAETSATNNSRTRPYNTASQSSNRPNVDAGPGSLRHQLIVKLIAVIGIKLNFFLFTNIYTFSSSYIRIFKDKVLFWGKK